MATGEQALVEGSKTITCLRHTEGVSFAYVQPRSPGTGAIRLFVDGEQVPCDDESAEYVPLLCASRRIAADVLRRPLQSSPSFRRLLEELLTDDWIWAAGAEFDGIGPGEES